MPLTYRCPSCGRHLRLPGDQLARRVRCPACDTNFAVGDDDEGTDPARPVSRGSLVLGLLALGFGVPALVLGAMPLLSLAGLAWGLPGFILGVGGAVFALARRRGGLPVAGAGAAPNLAAVVVAVVVTAVTGGPFRAPETVRAAALPQPEKAQEKPGVPVPEPVKAQEKPVVAVPEWGDKIDPDGDCTLRVERGGLTVSVPGTAHDLSAELLRVNAPRALWDATGDFTAEVRVTGVFRPGAAGTIPGRLPYSGAGLLLWRDESNYVRLERAAVRRGGAVTTYVAFEQREDGQTVAAQSMPLGDQDAVLRVQRRGDQVHGAVSANGGEWQAFQPLTATYPPGVCVGVAAINSSDEPFRIRFEDWRLTSP
jgi:regulation of enolase protein 1 (concanavalin A-like superfamily)